MIIGDVTYDQAGRLQAPMPIDLKLKQPLWNSTPTFEVGRYHRIKIADKNFDRLGQRVAHLDRVFQATAGLSVLSIDRSVAHVGNRIDYVIDIVYVVEASQNYTPMPASVNGR